MPLGLTTIVVVIVCRGRAQVWVTSFRSMLGDWLGNV